MHEPVDFRMHRMKACNLQIAEDLIWVSAWHDAAALAFMERTGREPVDGDDYTEEDCQRADLLMTMFPQSVSDSA